MITDPVNRLEESLRIWEDICAYAHWMARFVNKFTGGNANAVLNGPTLHSKTFRSALLQALNSPLLEFDSDKYLGTQVVADQIGAIHWLPLHLWLWTQSSRRIYRLTPELQLLLTATAPKGMKWEDISLPFDSFAVSLGSPITEPKNGKLYDLMLVSRCALDTEGIEGYPAIYILLLNQEVCKYRPLTKLECNAIEFNFKKSKAKKVERSLRKLDKATRVCHAIMAVFPLSLEIEQEEVLVLSLNSDGCQTFDSLPLLKQVRRIVAGLPLYLQTLPPAGSKESSWKPIDQKTANPDPKSIANESLVCALSSTHKLTSIERELIGLDVRGEKKHGSGHEVRAHFRCGHWRRPPGHGNDPTASRTIWVKPAIVRRDRLPPSSLPGGAETII